MGSCIVLVAPFTSLPSEQSNDRFSYIASGLSERGWRVKLVTSSFNHSSKAQRSVTVGSAYETVLISEPGYSKNVSLSRLWSHFVFGIRLARWLRTQDHEDLAVAYVAMPTTSAGLAVARFATTRGLPFLVDVQDIWPDAFTVALGNRRSQAFDGLVGMVSCIWHRFSRRVIERSALTVAVSHTYLEWAKRLGAKRGVVCYLGTDIHQQGHFPVREGKQPGCVWIAYQGTLGHSYDIKTLIEAVAMLQKEGIRNVQCHIVGDGPLLEAFKAHSRMIGAHDVFFHGRLPYVELMSILGSSDIAVNAITLGSKTSLPNKVFDYFASGLPIVNSVPGELQDLLDQYDAGLLYTPGNPSDLARALRVLVESPDTRRKMGANSYRLGCDIGNRQREYARLFDMIEAVARRGHFQECMSDTTESRRHRDW